MSRFAKTFLIALACLALVFCAFSPHLWVIAGHAPGSFEWNRAMTYLRQCAQPFDQNVEPAMRWRILPALVAHVMGLTGSAPLVIPWIGVVALVTWVAMRLRSSLDDWRFIAGGTLVFATTSACLVPIGWLGVNDAWIWLGLLVVAFAERPGWIVLCGLLIPWVDERFIIGLPLAWMIRVALRNQDRFPIKDLLWALLLVPYAALRIGFGGNPLSGHVERSFLSEQLHTSLISLPYAPLAWWMGLRLGWGAVLYGVVCLKGRVRWGVASTAVLTALISLALASDMSRSIAILCPLVMFGLVELARRRPADAPRIATWAGVLALIIPAAHVVFTKIAPIDNIVIELIRLHHLHP